MAAGNESSELQRHVIAALLDSGISREALIRTVNAVYSQRLKAESVRCDETKESNEPEHRITQPETEGSASDGACETNCSSDHDLSQPTSSHGSTRALHGEPVVDQMLR